MRLFTAEQQALLAKDKLRAHLLVAFFLDEGTYRFCDDVLDLSDGTNTWIGASALVSGIEFTSGSGLAAEPITLVCDGNRMAQAGIDDPAAVLRDILGYLHRQRRVDTFLGLGDINSEEVNIVIPLAAMKINYAQLVDEKVDLLSGEETVSKLNIVLDSLASRYSKATFRTRSHEDQLEIDPTDNFFSFTQNASMTESTLYWGKASPNGLATNSGVPLAGSSIFDRARIHHA